MYLANLCNSTIIEIYRDIIQVSHDFEYCQSLGFIAELNRFAENASPLKSYYSKINFVLLIKNKLVYNTFR
jgi:hypothetical protein